MRARSDGPLGGMAARAMAAAAEPLISRARDAAPRFLCRPAHIASSAHYFGQVLFGAAQSSRMPTHRRPPLASFGARRRKAFVAARRAYLAHRPSPDFGLGVAPRRVDWRVWPACFFDFPSFLLRTLSSADVRWRYVALHVISPRASSRPPVSPEATSVAAGTTAPRARRFRRAERAQPRKLPIRGFMLSTLRPRRVKIPFPAIAR